MVFEFCEWLCTCPTKVHKTYNGFDKPFGHTAITSSEQKLMVFEFVHGYTCILVKA